MSTPYFVLGFLAVVIGYIGLLHVLNDDLLLGFLCLVSAYTISFFNLKNYIKEVTK